MIETTDRDRELASEWIHPYAQGSWAESLIAVERLAEKIATAREEGCAEERERWLECARYDATTEGPLFKGWNRSALDRLRIKAERIASCCDTAGAKEKPNAG